MKLQDFLNKIRSLTAEKNMLKSDLEDLLSDVIECSRSELILKREENMGPQQIAAFESYVQRHLSGEPVAYILGHKYFYKTNFLVNRDVLIPRPDTETLVESALQLKNVQRFADLGIGSGCIGLSLLKEWPEAELDTWDVSERAITVAKLNAERMGVAKRINWNVGSPELSTTKMTYDLIISNPPYIDKKDSRLEDSVKNFEPHQALFAKNNGLEYYMMWTPWARERLNKNGWLMYECGEGQAKFVEDICLKNGLQNVSIKKDLSGIERVVSAQKKD